MRWVGQSDAGDAGEGEEVGFIGVATGTDKASDARGDTPPIDGGVSFILNEGYGSENRVAGGRFDETKEGVCNVSG